MIKKIIILILLFFVGICFSYNIIEGIENEKAKEEKSPEIKRFKELNDILIGGEKDNKDKISINDFFSKLNREKCEAVKEMIDLVNIQFSEEPGKGNEFIEKQMNNEIPFSEWASMFSFIIAANIGSTNILKKDNKCGILNYIKSLDKKEFTLGIPDIGIPYGKKKESNDKNMNFGLF
jgi:hypothetical protein